MAQNNNNREVVIITGSCGLIGSHVAKRLGKKYHIVGFELLKAIYAVPEEELVPVDISSDESVAQAFMHIRETYGTRIASVIHLAAYYSFEKKDSPLYDKITVEGTKRLLKHLQEFEVGQFIFSSTMLVHAPCKVGEKINEDSPICPQWAYPLSKVRTEEAMHELRGKIPTLTMRVAGVYNDDCHSIPISHQIQRIYEKKLEAHLFSGDTSHGASFVHLDDLVDAIEIAIEKRKTLPQELVLLIGEPETMSYDQLQRTISKLLFGKEITTYRVPKWFAQFGAWVMNLMPFLGDNFVKPWMISFSDDHYQLDISRAKKYLGWEPKHSLEKTLPIMIKKLKEDPVSWYQINHLKLPPKLRPRL